jgi:hypothetical protein
MLMNFLDYFSIDLVLSCFLCLLHSGVDNQKCPFCEIVKICNGLHHCVPLVEMVKKHIWNVQFGVQVKELCLQKDATSSGLLAQA